MKSVKCSDLSTTKKRLKFLKEYQPIRNIEGKRMLKKLLSIIIGFTVSMGLLADMGVYTVTATKLKVRIEPSIDAEVVRILNREQRVTVYETVNGWGRVSKYYDNRDKSQLVAEWTSMRHLSSMKVAALKRTLKKSDKYYLYQDVLFSTSQRLIDEGKCSIVDFQKLGGWLISTNYKTRDVFFVYCGGMSPSNKIMLDAKSGHLL